ncbi:MAG: serine hydrolase [Gemmatimonadota bacterium]|nr:serine hydrolase [Gemmatimonadota bacterium]
MLSLLYAVATLLTGGDGLPAKSPAAVGMSATRLAKINRALERGILAGGFPGASIVVGRKGFAVWERGIGRIAWSRDAAVVVPNRTIYDLASLTKVVATTTAIMILYDEGKLRLDDPVWRYVPAFAGGAKNNVTIRHLLTHRSGLPAGRDIWRIADSPWEAREAAIASALMPGCPPGACYEYSDLGPDILGFVAEAITGERLDKFLERRVWDPLGMTDTYFKPPASLQSRIAPTAITSIRGYPLRGEVHDDNAAVLGGVAGHAGLFSTASDLSIFAQMLLNGGTYGGVRIVSDTAVELFTTRATGSRALGWDTCRGDYGCGRYLSENAFGHTGFTGTSMWIDPDRDMFVILLTNRVYDARARRPAKVISDVRADVADAAALAVLDYGDVLAMPRAFRSDRAIGWNKSRIMPKKRSLKKARSAPRRSKKVRSHAPTRGKRSAATTRSARSAKSTVRKTSTRSAKRRPGSG